MNEVKFPPYYKEMFSSLDCSDGQMYLDRRVNWQDLDNLPDCGLGLAYPQFNEIIWKEINPDYDELITINARELLNRFDGEGYLLSAFKYHRIRCELAKNGVDRLFYYPEVCKNLNGEYGLIGGRHRLCALMKIYGVEDITVHKMRDDI